MCHRETFDAFDACCIGRSCLSVCVCEGCRRGGLSLLHLGYNALDDGIVTIRVSNPFHDSLLVENELSDVVTQSQSVEYDFSVT